ncbi:MAG: hypothetical protein K0Q55_2843 [Verrucomicrobia bacterium]|nr:hypothetical protein [Verrucomicrobiota bacterium]
MVREKGLEPSPLTGPDPKSGASAISPLAHPLGRKVPRLPGKLKEETQRGIYDLRP